MKWFKSLFVRRPPTAEERFEAAKKLARTISPEVLHDLMLIIALQSPMTLVQLLADAGAIVSPGPQPVEAAKPEVVN